MKSQEVIVLFIHCFALANFMKIEDVDFGWLEVQKDPFVGLSILLKFGFNVAFAHSLISLGVWLGLSTEIFLFWMNLKPQRFIFPVNQANYFVIFILKDAD